MNILILFQCNCLKTYVYPGCLLLFLHLFSLLTFPHNVVNVGWRKSSKVSVHARHFEIRRRLCLVTSICNWNEVSASVLSYSRVCCLAIFLEVRAQFRHTKIISLPYIICNHICTQSIISSCHFIPL